MTRTAAEKDHLSRFQILFGTRHIMPLADALNIHSRHHTGVHAALAQHIAYGKAVHRRSQHAHAVGADALNPSGAVLDTAPEVSAADDNADLCAFLQAGLHALADGNNKGKIVACTLLTAERFPADLDQNTPVL